MLSRSVNMCTWKGITRTYSSAVNMAANVELAQSRDIKGFNEIPGPRGVPFIGTAWQYVFHWNGLSFDKMFDAYQRRYEKYGVIYKRNMLQISPWWSLRTTRGITKSSEPMGKCLPDTTRAIADLQTKKWPWHWHG
ncbi:hypothetical protein EB796_011212 [Bugula neritina]|uniref:Uncharacterized protein n=1 Tax=Bugula neritina TaxID=10212 RepID=A0A7J7JWZ0_BUGNE|nr:hypothetical protein EB796_011212 [Bugula neritina]